LSHHSKFRSDAPEPLWPPDKYSPALMLNKDVNNVNWKQSSIFRWRHVSSAK